MQILAKIGLKENENKYKYLIYNYHMFIEYSCNLLKFSD